VPSLDDILAERDKLADEWKALHALYGANGTAKEKLENLYAVIAADVRDKLMKAHAAGGTKPTEGMIEEAVRRDVRWTVAIDTQTKERAEYAMLDKRMDDFKDRVQWAQACIRYATSEPK
jgi:hypothetical protein